MNTVFTDKIDGPIVVFGDLIIDSTLIGSCSRLANEGAIPVFVEKEKKYSLGGCGNVAANLKAMGADVILISVEGGDRLISTVFKNRIDYYLSKNPNSKTTLKTRAFADNKLVFRHDIEESYVTDENIKELKEYVMEVLYKYKPSCIVISDYNRGVCSEDMCKYLIDIANKRKIPVIVDPKNSCSKYNGCTLIKPNLSETKRLTGLPSSASIVDHHKELNKITKARFTCITQASDGISLYDHIAIDEYKFKMPQVEVCDVTGAGDIVCATLAYCIALNICPEMMIKASVFMGTQSVKHAGSYVLQENDFVDLRRHLYPAKRITIDEIQFLPRNKKIVFTNGCFDIFHMGHIESLRKSKSFGDILVVGLNSDESISKIKGPERPIMDLDNRLAILESLEFVDFVIVFDKKTPYAILEALKPDVYVKGAEYRGKYLEGYSYAGRVEYIEFETIISTSSIVNKIRNTIYCRPKQEKYII